MSSVFFNNNNNNNNIFTYSQYINNKKKCLENNNILKDCFNTKYSNTFFDICSTYISKYINDNLKKSCNINNNLFKIKNIPSYSDYNYILDICNTLIYCNSDNNSFKNYENYHKIINKLKLECNINQPIFYNGISYEEYINIIKKNNNNNNNRIDKSFLNENIKLTSSDKILQKSFIIYDNNNCGLEKQKNYNNYNNYNYDLNQINYNCYIENSKDKFNGKIYEGTYLIKNNKNIVDCNINNFFKNNYDISLNYEVLVSETGIVPDPPPSTETPDTTPPIVTPPPPPPPTPTDPGPETPATDTTDIPGLVPFNLDSNTPPWNGPPDQR